jgi:hypothetical protein
VTFGDDKKGKVHGTGIIKLVDADLDGLFSKI